MNEQEEKAYLEGERAAYLHMLKQSLKALGITDSPEGRQLAWLIEREQAVAQLRILCREFGDNEWEPNEHLADVIDKHLGRHLHHRLMKSQASDPAPG